MPTKPRHRARRGRLTKIARLERVLRDGKWHATSELVRKVGHTFARFKYLLVSYGHVIERERHRKRRRQFIYRLVDEPQAGAA